jgi:hypothetical protein
VTRRSLSTRTQFNGTLGYAGSYQVIGRAPGTVTSLPNLGVVIRDGRVLYRVNGAPVVLLYGAVPAWRTLAEGAPAGGGAAADVAQLNHDLVALGYVQRADVASDWSDFNRATRAGVMRLQGHLAVHQTGVLALGTVVFLPSAARVTAVLARLGAPALGPVLQASSTMRTVSVALDPDLQEAVNPGDRVTISLPDGGVTPGRVASVGTVATQPSGSGESGRGPTIPVAIRPTRPAATGRLDRALVAVAILDRTVHDVLAVPVTALLARSGGGYSVEVVANGGEHRLVRVRVGLFDDVAGMVQVSGSGLAAGQRVVVPGDE